MANTTAKRKAAKRQVKATPGRKSPRNTTTKPKSAAKRTKVAKSARKKSGRTKAAAIAVTNTPFQLPERFDSGSAAVVLDSFKRHRGRALKVDASAVRRVGAQGMQILLSATRTWASDGYALSVENPSAELIDAAHLLGLSNSELSISGSMQ